MGARKKKPADPREWIVTVIAEVKKDVVVSGLSRADALVNPYSGNVIDELEMSVINWRAVSIRENA